MTTHGEYRKRTSFVACWVILKEPGALIVVTGTALEPHHQHKFGSMMFIAWGMNRALPTAVMADGEATTVVTSKTSV